LQEWTEEHGITVVDWPPYSPDMNPIENLWKILKERIHEKDPALADMPKNVESFRRLKRVAIEVWEEIPEEVLQHLVESMERRLAAVIKANGWYTKY
jgi:transposase